MAPKQSSFDAETVAKHAIHSLGRGYDIICDLRLSASKASNGGPLIVFSDKERQKLAYLLRMCLPSSSVIKVNAHVSPQMYLHSTR